MRITTKATNTTLTPAILEYVEKKIGNVEKLIDEAHREAARADVEIEVTTHHHKAGEAQFRAEVNLHAGEMHLRAEEFHADLYAAIDAVKDELTRNIVSRKGKQQSRLRRGGQRIKEMLKGFPWRG